MVALSCFQNLIEIQSLENNIGQHLKNIEKEKDRLNSLRKKRSESLNEIQAKKNEERTLVKEIGIMEKDLDDVQKKLNKSNENMKIAKSTQQLTAIEHELKTLSPKIENFENSILEKLDQLEQMRAKIQELETFYGGSEATIREISQEVDKHIKKEQREIDNYQERIKLLKEQCSPEAVTAYEDSNKRYKFKSPLAFIDNSKCTLCKFSINRNAQSLVDRGNIIELCPNCERVLVPFAAHN